MAYLEKYQGEVLNQDALASSAVLLTMPRDPNLDVEIAATLLYEHSHYRFPILYRILQGRADWASNFVAKAASIRGEHEELSRAFRAGGGLVFDIAMDIGGMRDLHRHRRCTQIFQAYDAREWAAPEISNLPVEFKAAMNRAQLNFDIMRKLRQANGGDAETAAYLLPLGIKRRFLMKMDTAEVDYIAELSTKAAGHISYQSNLASEPFQEMGSAGLDRGGDEPRPLLNSDLALHLRLANGPSRRSPHYCTFFAVLM